MLAVPLRPDGAPFPGRNGFVRLADTVQRATTSGDTQCAPRGHRSSRAGLPSLHVRLQQEYLRWVCDVGATAMAPSRLKSARRRCAECTAPARNGSGEVSAAAVPSRTRRPAATPPMAERSKRHPRFSAAVFSKVGGARRMAQPTSAAGPPARVPRSARLTLHRPSADALFPADVLQQSASGFILDLQAIAAERRPSRAAHGLPRRQQLSRDSLLTAAFCIGARSGGGRGRRLCESVVLQSRPGVVFGGVRREGRAGVTGRSWLHRARPPGDRTRADRRCPRAGAQRRRVRRHGRGQGGRKLPLLAASPGRQHPPWVSAAATAVREARGAGPGHRAGSNLPAPGRDRAAALAQPSHKTGGAPMRWARGHRAALTSPAFATALRCAWPRAPADNAAQHTGDAGAHFRQGASPRRQPPPRGAHARLRRAANAAGGRTAGRSAPEPQPPGTRVGRTGRGDRGPHRDGRPPRVTTCGIQQTVCARSITAAVGSARGGLSGGASGGASRGSLWKSDMSGAASRDGV